MVRFSVLNSCVLCVLFCLKFFDFIQRQSRNFSNIIQCVFSSAEHAKHCQFLFFFHALFHALFQRLIPHIFHNFAHDRNSLLAFFEKSNSFCQDIIIHIRRVRTGKIVHQLAQRCFISVCTIHIQDMRTIVEIFAGRQNTAFYLI